MKLFLISSLTSLLLLSGCSSQFERYTPSDTKELAATSYKNGSIVNKQGKTKVMMSAIYLNHVYPKYDHETAQFLVGIYSRTKPPVSLYFYCSAPKDVPHAYSLTLGREHAILSKKLEADDPLIDLMPIASKWVSYYFVSFKKPKNSKKSVLKLKGKRGKIKLIFKDNQPVIKKNFL